MYRDKTALIRNIGEGDIFHAEGETGASRICIVVAVRATTILARDISIQAIYEFDRQTGVAIRYFGVRPYRYTIDSVAPLPADIHNIMLELDRKHREVECRSAEYPDGQCPASVFPLTEDETKAYSFIAEFYPKYPLGGRNEDKT